jgi:hypothetical protein
MVKFNEAIDMFDAYGDIDPHAEEVHRLCLELNEFQELADLLIAKAEEAGVKLEIDHDGRSFVVYANRVNYRPMRQPFKPRVVKH